MKPISALLLVVWDALDTSKEFPRAEGQSVDEYMAKYDQWLIGHEETAKLIQYLSHHGIGFAEKIQFMGDWGLA